MSEYQYVAFRAIDRAVSPKNLAYMQRQSTRAEITPWSFTNEYHFGDFRGNAVEMLRRGYDIHLHYANFGVRKLLIRLPKGLPDARAAKPYLDGESLRLVKDKRGPAATLAIEPFYESGELEEFYDIDEMLERLIALRAEILDGDLRPFYIAHLAVGCDGDHDPEEAFEAPLPAGLVRPTKAQRALAELYGISPALLAAAASDAPALESANDTSPQIDHWLRKQSETTKNAWLAELMAHAGSPVRETIMEAFRREQPSPTWLVAQSKRTMAALQAAADNIQRDDAKKASAKAARSRIVRLEKLAQDPAACFRKVEELVAQRDTAAYRQASELLADLREALADRDQFGIAEAQAEKLRDKNPQLRHLVSALRRQDFLPKRASPKRKG